MSGNDNIEKLFRLAFDGYAEKPSPGLWNRLSRKLAWREFFRFSWSSLNVYYVAALVGTGVGVWLMLSPAMTRPDHPRKDQVKEIQEFPPVSVVTDTNTTTDVTGNTVSEERSEQKTVGMVSTGKPPTETKQKNTVPEVVPEKVITEKEENREGEMVRDENPVIKDQMKTGQNQPAPETVADFSSDVQAGCPPLSVHFRNLSEEYTDLLWDFGDGTTSRETDPGHVFTEPGQYGVTLKVYCGDGSVLMARDTITVHDKPVARFEKVIPDHQGDEQPVNFYNNSVDAVKYQWDFGDHTTSLLPDPIHHYTGEGPYDVKLKVWSAEGCTDSVIARKAIQLDPYYIRFPNAFAPNPNGPCDGFYTEGMNINEVFHPVYYGVVEFNLRIFNRYGELVFESNDIRRGWDGYINGTLASPDVYVWKARGKFENGKSFMQYGNLTLVKK